MKIILCGFMGAGKTTLLKKINQHIPQWPCLDLDELIFQIVRLSSDSNLGQSIERIGWQEFRSIESKELTKFLETQSCAVLSLGGGALTQENLSKIQSSPQNLLVWVDTNIDLCLARIKGDKSRPLAQKSMSELKVLYEERTKLYNKSHVKLSELLQDFPDFPINFDLEKALLKYVGSA